MPRASVLGPANCEKYDSAFAYWSSGLSNEMRPPADESAEMLDDALELSSSSSLPLRYFSARAVAFSCAERR